MTKPDGIFNSEIEKNITLGKFSFNGTAKAFYRAGPR